MGRRDFEAKRAPGGGLLVGSPPEVADKIIVQHGILSHERFLIQRSVGTLPHADVMHAIELLGTQVAPVGRRETAATVALLGTTAGAARSR